MTRDKAEKLGSLFLAVFSTGLAAQLMAEGMGPTQIAGALVAVLGSVGMAVGVRLWPHPAQVEARERG